MACTTCHSLGLKRFHEVCPVRQSYWCTQCSCYGHLAATCDTVTHVERPRCLEDLIPADIRARWGIRTQTAIVWPAVTLEIAEREIAETNTIEVVYREGRQDNRIREVMRSLKIPTVHKMEGNIQKLRTWAVANGKKVRLIQEK